MMEISVMALCGWCWQMGSIAVMEKAMLIIMNDTGGDVRGDGGYSNAGEGGDGKYALILGIGFELFHW